MRSGVAYRDGRPIFAWATGKGCEEAAARLLRIAEGKQ